MRRALVLLPLFLTSCGDSALDDGGRRPWVTCTSTPTVAFDFKLVRVDDVEGDSGSQRLSILTTQPCASWTARLGGAPLTVEGGPLEFSALVARPETPTILVLEMTCRQHPEECTFFAPSIAVQSVLLNECLPEVVSHGPTGAGVPRAEVMRVTFSCEMDPASVTAQTVSLDRVNGTVSYDEPTRTATFTPASPLMPGETYTASVKGGPNGVVEKTAGQQLRTTLSATGVVDPGRDVWRFSVASENGE